VKNDRRAKFLAIIYFNQWSKLRHHYRRRNAGTLVGKRLSVIARMPRSRHALGSDGN
jgi:hypothetical protein